MLNILTITTPIYCLIAVGFLAVRWGMFAREDSARLGKFVLYFALPALLFKTLSQRSFAEIFNLNYLAAYGVGSLSVFLVAFFLGRMRRKEGNPFHALCGMGMAFSNTAFIGYPILSQWLGPTAAVALALCMLVENLLLLPLMLVLAESERDTGTQKWRVAFRSIRNLTKNPLIIAIVAGFGFSFLGIRLPEPVSRPVDMLAAASVPVALFVIGGSLVGLKIWGMMRDVAIVAAGKLFIHPLVVGLMLWLLPPMDPLFRTAALGYACMPMLGIYPILAQKYRLEGFCAAALLMTTWLSFFTISIIFWFMRNVLHWAG